MYDGQKRLRQTNAAAFVPPKLRTKGRFQGISRLAQWAVWILDIMAVQGQVKEDSTVATLRRGFSKLPRLRSFIEKFALTCKVMNELQEHVSLPSLGEQIQNFKTILQHQSFSWLGGCSEMDVHYSFSLVQRSAHEPLTV